MAKNLRRAWFTIGCGKIYPEYKTFISKIKSTFGILFIQIDS
jgi:hypothetical protein